MRTSEVKVGISLSKLRSFRGASLCLFSGSSAQNPRKMQYRALGTYGVGAPEGAECSDEKTNSGESILPMCSRNVDFHGAGLGAAVEDVEAMLRDWIARLKCEIRGSIREAMIAVFYDRLFS